MVTCGLDGLQCHSLIAEKSGMVDVFAVPAIAIALAIILAGVGILDHIGHLIAFKECLDTVAIQSHCGRLPSHGDWFAEQ